MLGLDELLEVEEAVEAELKDNLSGILSKLNRTGKLEDFLSMLELDRLLQPDNGYRPYRTGKIVVLGASGIKADTIFAVGKKYGLDKSRFELCLDYDETVKYPYSKLKWNSNYSVVLVGPMHHSGTVKGNAGSIIAALEQEEGYPPVVRLGNGKLKITKSDFTNKITELMEKGTIV